MEERKMILKMIEEGKITAEEGLTLLQELDRQMKLEQGTRASELAAEGKEPKVAKEPKGPPTFPKEPQMLKLKDDIQKFTDKFLAGTNRWVSKMDKVGKVFQKISSDELDLDIDIFSGHGMKVTEVYEVAPHRMLQFKTFNGSIKCKPWEKEYIQIEVKAIDSKAQSEWQVKEKLKELIEQQESEGKYSLTIDKDNEMRVSIEVFLPTQKYESITILTSNGKVQLAELESEQTKIETSNGSIRVVEFRGKQLQATTSNGAIKLSEVDVEHVSLQTSNGRISADGKMTALISETSNGSIHIEQEATGESKIKAKTTNGSVHIEYPHKVQGVYGQIKSSFFNQIKCNLSNVKIVEEHEPDHRVMIEQGEEKKHYVEVETSRGSIHLYETGLDD
jgi:DUF4097 and DUF4098 domain-containing protein YvlB